jgi:hypothetical protein
MFLFYIENPAFMPFEHCTFLTSPGPQTNFNRSFAFVLQVRWFISLQMTGARLSWTAFGRFVDEFVLIIVTCVEVKSRLISRNAFYNSVKNLYCPVSIYKTKD